jgi:hypothetical protein
MRNLARRYSCVSNAECAATLHSKSVNVRHPCGSDTLVRDIRTVAFYVEGWPPVCDDRTMALADGGLLSDTSVRPTRPRLLNNTAFSPAGSQISLLRGAAFPMTCCGGRKRAGRPPDSRRDAGAIKSGPVTADGYQSNAVRRNDAIFHPSMYLYGTSPVV